MLEEIKIQFCTFSSAVYVIQLLFFYIALQDQFRDYLLLEAERRDLRAIIENKSRIILAHCNSGYK